MKLLIVRHGDPDYSIDSLTEKGWREAEYLSERLSRLDVAAFYVSPLGRAKDTASRTLEKMGRTAVEKEWLREFRAPVRRPDRDGLSIAWDWLPQDWVEDQRFYQLDHWYEHPAFAEARVKQEYDWVTSNFDQLLACHGYVREGNAYRVEKANNDTVILFCHFGVECVLLSRLMNLSPMVLWHTTCAAPTSVTTVVTEERRQGIGIFRVTSFADISHLYVHGEPPAFAARFCETYGNQGERHD